MFNIVGVPPFITVTDLWEPYFSRYEPSEMVQMPFHSVGLRNFGGGTPF